MFYSNSEISKEIITPTVRLRLINDSIIHYTYLEKSVIDIEAHKINNEALKKIAIKEKHPILIDSIEYVEIDTDARKYIRSLEKNAPILARAVVTESLANKLLIRFYNTVHKPIYPIKLFSTYKDAVLWLKSFEF